MKHDDLMRKLENLETPEIEVPGHRQALRMVLLNSGRFEKRTVMDWAKILVPVTAAVALLLVVGFLNVIQPQLQMAQAKEIAINDHHVQSLVSEYGLEIAEVKLRNGEAFVLLAPQSTVCVLYGSTPEGYRLFRWPLPFFPGPPEPTPGEDSPIPPGELSHGYIIKVDLLEKKVSELGEIDEITALDDINLAGVDFVKLEPPEGTALEDADPK